MRISGKQVVLTLKYLDSETDMLYQSVWFAWSEAAMSLRLNFLLNLVILKTGAKLGGKTASSTCCLGLASNRPLDLFRDDRTLFRTVLIIIMIYVVHPVLVPNIKNKNFASHVYLRGHPTFRFYLILFHVFW